MDEEGLFVFSSDAVAERHLITAWLRHCEEQSVEKGCHSDPAAVGVSFRPWAGQYVRATVYFSDGSRTLFRKPESLE